MFLKRIELIGFKSFATKTTLEFLPRSSGETDVVSGVTAIVGPNGSGKSNVADAIRWVMGEQSAKSLRGKKSHDVIFAGGTGKSRLNYAQVTLVLDNADKRIPIAFGEVSISRKIYRDGEGEYFINDSRSRMIDVVDLLAKAGIGKESHCVLNQGMSDAALNASPFERRSIIEEAAGVKPFQLKRERSLRKLDSAEDNLVRTRQLLAEIEPRLRILKRQAQRAQQREEVERELRAVQTAYYGYLWTRLEDEKTQAEQLRDAAAIKVTELQRTMESMNEDRKTKSALMNSGDEEVETQADISRKRQTLSILERERAIVQGTLEVERQKERAQKLVDIIPVDLRFVRGQLSRIRVGQDRLISKLGEVSDMAEIVSIRQEADAIRKELDSLHEDCGKTTVERARADDVIESERRAFRERIESLDKECTALSGKILEREKEIRDLEERIIAANENRKAVNEQFFALERQIHAFQRDIDFAREKHGDAKVALARLEAHEEDLAREILTELGVDPKSIAPHRTAIDRDETLVLISRLKSRLALIGGIDPMVAQEYRETQERYDFLTKETDDLQKTMDALRGVIADMDDRIETEFSRAFQEMNREFNRFFQLMFDGGRAELRSVKLSPPEEENPDDAGDSPDDSSGAVEAVSSRSREIGIDIVVHPPKKKIHNLSMMSGGERSLVSLALLFAIIAYNPPPFSVLDEVEAALDEANSRRFSLLVRELSQRTQFIIITHNRETMRTANMLYGVTMGADGVSKLLSVKLEGDYDEKEDGDTKNELGGK